MIKGGYMPIGRDIFEPDIWGDKHKLSKLEAYLWMFDNAAYEDTVVYVDGKSVELTRGQFCKSFGTLSEEWGWGKTAVRRFVKMLCDTHRLTIETPPDARVQRFSLSNYTDLKIERHDVGTTLKRHLAHFSDCESEDYGVEPARHLARHWNDIEMIPLIKNKKINNTTTTTSTNVDSVVAVDVCTNLVVDYKGGIIRGEIWRKDFDQYLHGLREIYNSLRKDEVWLAEQRKLNPNVDILLTLEKACVNYWATEAGWAKKKKSRSKAINWRTTLQNSISQNFNRVYENKTNNRSPHNDDRSGVSDEYKQRLLANLGFNPNTGKAL